MAKSLQDQLLQAGVVDKNRATKIKKAKHKKAKQRARGSAEPDEIGLTVKQALAKKAERDRLLSRQRQAVLDETAIAAQVRQLIEKYRIDRRGGETPYSFVDDGTVKKIHVNGKQQAGLTAGQIAVVRLGSAYELIPAPVAAKLAERDAGAVVLLNEGNDEGPIDDDPYADYDIPDDLRW